MHLQPLYIVDIKGLVKVFLRSEAYILRIVNVDILGLGRLGNIGALVIDWKSALQLMNTLQRGLENARMSSVSEGYKSD